MEAKPVRRWIAIVAATMAAGFPIGLATPATADPAEDPCRLAISLLCRMVPIAPELDHDVDLTQNQPPADPPVPLPENVTPSDPCVAECI